TPVIRMPLETRPPRKARSRTRSACVSRCTSNSSAECVRNPTTLTEWRTSPVKVVKELDVPAQSDFATWTLNAPIGKTCVGDARTNACPATAPSASNTSFSESRKRFC
ncbi:zygote arrest 1, isoform CRA_a, partial [Mus musculus]